jgi:hypothetical protein
LFLGLIDSGFTLERKRSRNFALRNLQVVSAFGERRFLGAMKYGYPHEFRWRFLVRLSELFTKAPINFSRPKFVDCGTLIQWDFVFREKDLNFFVCTRDRVPRDEASLRREGKLDKFAQDQKADRAILVAKEILQDGDLQPRPMSLTSSSSKLIRLSQH